ncbi:MAG: hypothetical protein ABJB12_10800 [Pseudomonadota bacterium]
MAERLSSLRSQFALSALALSVLVSGSAEGAPPNDVIDVKMARQVFPGLDDCVDVPCLLTRAYRADPKAAQLALDLWTESGDVAGVGSEQVMDGGFRGTIHLVPELPINRYRQQLAWVVEASRTTNHFFEALFANQPAPPYRFRGVTFRFVRSLKQHRPSAYVTGWAVEYNVEGSLLISASGVRDTLFHELFHSNDEAHGDWSGSHLRDDYQAILEKCKKRGLSVPCLGPYAPTGTLVRGGTFYAFQQNNGDTVHEYGAELAVRYFTEQSQMLAAGKLGRPAFKCGPPENARSWRSLVAEFFGGRDLVPACR